MNAMYSYTFVRDSNIEFIFIDIVMWVQASLRLNEIQRTIRSQIDGVIQTKV
jgi:hypothetical protein